MIDKIIALEKQASPLEPNANQRLGIRKKVVNYTENFLEALGTKKCFNDSPENGIGLLDAPISDTPRAIDQTLKLFEDNVDFPGLNPASGGHLAYIPGGGIYVSSLGDYLAAITNRYSGVFYASPGAVRMTNLLLNWMADMLGYPKTAGGNLLSGGSIANLTAIVTAREAFQIKGKDYKNTVVYCTEHAHHCLNKAIRIAGLSECIQREIPMDTKYRMDTGQLEKQISLDLESGLKPWLVIASAGTTDVGAIDPLDQIGDICIKHKLWFHIDGAYGAFFNMTKKGKTKLKGIEKSNSIVLDPHKGMFLPYGLGVVIIRELEKLKQAHAYSANYMQDSLTENEEVSPADISPELTQHFRALRLWLPLQLYGTVPFVACLDEKLLLAKYFYNKLQEMDGFETGPEPELSVVTYRYIPQEGDPDEFNRALLNKVVKDGRIFISSTLLDGNFTLRLAILSFRTHLATVDLALQVLREQADLLESR
jgi:glutamate/tyrosine decarboxylase-like PLP-dependent enzyme